MSDPEIIYGRNPVEEAKRGRRKVLRVWEAPETPETRLVELCGSTDHQGIVAEVEPFPYLSGSDLLAGELDIHEDDHGHQASTAWSTRSIASAAGLGAGAIALLAVAGWAGR